MRLVSVVSRQGRLLPSPDGRRFACAVSAPLLNFVIALAALLLGGLAVALGNTWAWALVALGAVLLWGYARDGGVGAAFSAFKQGNLDAVRRALRHTLWPGLLASHKRAYHHWMQGVVLASECRFPAAREQLLLAASGEIQTENDRCLIQCLLVEVALQLEEWSAAAEHLRLAGNLHHHPQIDAMIGALDQRLRERAGAARTQNAASALGGVDATKQTDTDA